MTNNHHINFHKNNIDFVKSSRLNLFNNFFKQVLWSIYQKQSLQNSKITLGLKVSVEKKPNRIKRVKMVSKSTLCMVPRAKLFYFP